MLACRRFIDIKEIQVWFWNHATGEYVFSATMKKKARLIHEFENWRTGTFLSFDQLKYLVEPRTDLNTDTHYGYIPQEKGRLPIAFLLPKKEVDTLTERAAMDLAMQAVRQ